MLRTAIVGATLASVLVLALSPSVLARSEPQPEDGEPVTMAAASAAALAQALEAAPSVLWPDAPAPASLAGFVSAAREQLWDNAIDRFRWPLHLRFLEARCNDEGAVALVFREIRPVLGWRTYAVAWRGSMPTSTEDGWGGGSGMSSVLDDSEFVFQMGSDTFACP